MSKNIIHVLNKTLALKQPPEGFRTSIDAVLLAAACPIKEGQALLDLGCGIGTAGLCAVRRVKNIKLTGIDIQADHIEIAKENAARNELEATFKNADIATYEAERADHIICNPPFLAPGTHTASPSEAKATAKGNTNLADWIKSAHRNLKSKGSFTIIHRADHTDQIIREMGKKFGQIEIIPLWPKRGAPAKRVIIRALKDSKSPSILHPGLILHKENGDYTDEAENILRKASRLT